MTEYQNHISYLINVLHSTVNHNNWVGLNSLIDELYNTKNLMVAEKNIRNRMLHDPNYLNNTDLNQQETNQSSNRGSSNPSNMVNNIMGALDSLINRAREINNNHSNNFNTEQNNDNEDRRTLEYNDIMSYLHDLSQRETNYEETIYEGTGPIYNFRIDFEDELYINDDDDVPVPLSYTDLSSLPIMTYKTYKNHHGLNNNEMDQCSICITKFKEDEEGNSDIIRQLKCGHIFHITCIDRWFSTKPSCPLCKKDQRN